MNKPYGRIYQNNVNVSLMPLDIYNFYPVGSIYISVVNTNPSTWFGGTWQSFGAGRCLFAVDTAQTEFNTVQKTGGAKTHSHTISHTHTLAHTHSMGAHTHSRGTLTAAINLDSSYIRSRWQTSGVSSWTSNARKTVSGSNVDYSATQSEGTPVFGVTGGMSAAANTGGASKSTTSGSSVASSGSSSSLPPYITVYMWRRIS